MDGHYPTYHQEILDHLDTVAVQSVNETNLVRVYSLQQQKCIVWTNVKHAKHNITCKALKGTHFDDSRCQTGGHRFDKLPIDRYT